VERDMDLIRQILLTAEEMPFWQLKPNWRKANEIPFFLEESTGPNFRDIESHRDEEGFLNLGQFLGIEGYSSEKISYHARIMDEADLIVTTKEIGNKSLAQYSTTLVYIPMGLTWKGHEFLEAVRDDSRWNKVKDTMSRAEGFVFDVAKALALTLLEQKIMSLVSSP